MFTITGVFLENPISHLNFILSRLGLNLERSTPEPITWILSGETPFSLTSCFLITRASAMIFEQPYLKIKARFLFPIGSAMQRARVRGIHKTKSGKQRQWSLEL